MTGTPLAGLRNREKWFDQAQVLEDGLSVRKAAVWLKIHRTTAFRWRHRFLVVPREVKADHMEGIVAADESYFLRSYKGQLQRLGREQSRQARRRGGHASKRGLSDEQVPVLVARNLAGKTTDALLAQGNKPALVAVLSQMGAADAVLCTDSSANAGRCGQGVGRSSSTD